MDKTSAISRKVSEQSIDLVNKVRNIKPTEDDGENPIDELFDQDPNSKFKGN